MKFQRGKIPGAKFEFDNLTLNSILVINIYQMKYDQA